MKRLDNLYAKYEEAYAKKVKWVGDASKMQSPKYTKTQFNLLYTANRKKYLEGGGNIRNAARDTITRMVNKQAYGRIWTKAQLEKAQTVFTDAKGKPRTQKYIKENISDLIREKSFEYDEAKDMGLINNDTTLSEYIGKEVFGSN